MLVAIVIGAGIGLRSSEAAGLTADRVDFLRRTERIDRQWQQATQTTTGGFTTTKTRASNRVIPTSQWVLDEIAAHLARRPAGEHGVIVTPDGQPLDAARGAPTSAEPASARAWPTRSRSTISGTSSPRC